MQPAEHGHGGESTNYAPFPSFVAWADSVFTPTVVDRFDALLQRSRGATDSQHIDAALAVATRYAAVDTGAIEGLYTVDRGFTRTIATKRPHWEQVLQDRGDQVRAAILDAINAYDFVRESAPTVEKVSEVWIRELHELVCASQANYVVETDLGRQERPLPKGVYKLEPNSPTLPSGALHAYAPVLDTPPEMARLIQELRTESFLSAHPVLQASYAHYAYVCVHPFADGNGRVARALASLYLYARPGVPLVVFADQRTEYLDALEAADDGRHDEFVSFVEQRVLDAMGIVQTNLRRNPDAIPSAVAAISNFYASGGVDQEMLATVSRARGLIYEEFRRQCSKLGLPQQIEIGPVQSPHGEIPLPSDYAATGPTGALMLWTRSPWPIAFNLRRGFAIFVRSDSDAPSDFVCKATSGDDLEFWLRELLPSETESLKIRLTAWAEGHLEEVVALAQAQIEHTD